MVMLDLFIKADLPIGVAHIDHKTRMGQSTVDADFVQAYCDKHQIPCYRTTFESDSAKENNFQAAARNFRYQYFETLCSQHEYDYICTAHHKNDKLETLLINLGRGAGLAGMSTLPYVTKDKRVRPLLPFSRAELEAYATEHAISYVHDSSNDEDDYDRNRLRHHVIPELLKIYPHYLDAASKTSNYLLAEHELLSTYIAEDRLIKTEGNMSTIDLREIKTRPQAATILYRLLADQGFTFSDCKDILNCRQIGSRFVTADLEALYQGDRLILRPLSDALPEWEVMASGLGKYTTLHVEVDIVEQQATMTESRPMASFLVAPAHVAAGVCIRSPRPGDRIKPWHMGGKSKTLKKLMVDEKLSRFEKEQVVVVSDHKDQILYVKTSAHLHSHHQTDRAISTWFINVYVKK